MAARGAEADSNSSLLLEAPPKTNLCSMSPHAAHWRVSRANPSGMVASPEATAVTIISAPHAKQRILTTSLNDMRNCAHKNCAIHNAASKEGDSGVERVYSRIIHSTRRRGIAAPVL
jgi:hypothetical protein